MDSNSARKLPFVADKRLINGFSLTETLITVSIVSVLATLAAPQFARHTSKLTLRSEATKLRVYLERCAAYALASQSTVTISATSTALSATHDDGSELSSHVLRNGVELQLPGSTEDTILFHPTISASPTTLILHRARVSCSVIISLRGRVRLAC